MIMEKTLRQEKKEILDKYFPNMGISECDFDVDTGKCKKCGIFFAESKMRLCSVIGKEEVKRFKNLTT